MSGFLLGGMGGNDGGKRLSFFEEKRDLGR